MKLADFVLQDKTYVVAEIAQAHDGSVGILHSLVEAAASTGVNAVKFQVHIANAESSVLEPFRVQFSHVDKTRFDYWRRMELTPLQWEGLKKHCDDLNVEFLATPFSNTAVDLLESIGIEKYKVGSGDLTNYLLLNKIALTGKEVILSTGLGDLYELKNAVAIFKGKNIPCSILQCTTRYPTSADEIGLEWLSKFKEQFDCPVGLSDHSGKIFSGLGAVALGATIIEAHITFDRRMFGPDAKASLTVDEFAILVEGIRFIERARSSGVSKDLDSSKEDLRRMFGKSLSVNRNLLAGHIISFDDLEGKKPADAGIPVAEYESVLGRTLVRDKSCWDFLVRDDLK